MIGEEQRPGYFPGEESIYVEGGDDHTVKFAQRVH